MNGITGESASRREFLKKTGLFLTTATVICPAGHLAQAEEKAKEQQGEKVSPPEDLMREHGVLRRILLIYEDIQARLNSAREFPPEVLTKSAGIIRRFIEEYHEKLEEDYLFPRFEKAGKLVELVKVLKEQHKAGRLLTEYIKTSASAATVKDAGKRKELAEKIHLFTRMYRPHASREDTILFPALRSIVSAEEFDSLGEEFEDKEVALFGESGFEKVVGEVADLEKPLGIYELAQFTPPK
ncbi:MAG TPA: hemerythrin domain-containing protein [Desulfomonilaceae bacterium]|nr:hemerythrin domain-containing protein [Desulfomonilaceae bacterium]